MGGVPENFAGAARGPRECGLTPMPTLFGSAVMLVELSIKVWEPRPGSHKSMGPRDQHDRRDQRGWAPGRDRRLSIQGKKRKMFITETRSFLPKFSITEPIVFHVGS